MHGMNDTTHRDFNVFLAVLFGQKKTAIIADRLAINCTLENVRGRRSTRIREKSGQKSSKKVSYKCVIFKKVTFSVEKNTQKIE